MSELRPWAGFDSLVDGLARLQARAREAAVRSVDEILTLRNWLIGAWIVAYEQEGADRARYGEGLIDALAAAFTARGIQGLSGRNLRNYRQLALTWPRLGIRQTASGESGAPVQIWQTLSAESVPALTTGGELLPWQDDAWILRLRRELSFSHLLELSRASDPLARAFYEVQVLAHRWSVRELKRQRDSMLFDRVGLSRDREAVLAFADEGQLLDTATANVRDPYVLEFLGLPERQAYSEGDLEGALVEHLQEFLLELGGDFAFLGRQYRITVGGRHQILTDLCKWMDANGALATLRHGFKCYGRTLHAAFFKAAHELNPELEVRYAANCLGLTRQLQYRKNQDAQQPGDDEKRRGIIDLTLSLNGIPIATLELKNPLTNQMVEDARRQYKHDRDPREPIFEFKRRTLVHFAVDTESVLMTTRLAASATHFLPFNKGCDGGVGNPPDRAGQTYRTASRLSTTRPTSGCSTA